MFVLLLVLPRGLAEVLAQVEQQTAMTTLKAGGAGESDNIESREVGQSDGIEGR